MPEGAPEWKQKQYFPGETFSVIHKFTFDKQNLPDLPVEIELSLEYSNVRIEKVKKMKFTK